MPEDPRIAELRMVLARSVVGLSIVSCPPIAERAQSKNTVAMRTGFIVEINGAWKLVTAGHVLLELRNAVDKGCKLDIKLVDGWHREDGKTTPIPFDPMQLGPMAIDHDGDDFGIVPLGPHYERLLAANGVDAVPERQIRGVPPPADFYAVVGFPEMALNARLVDQDRISQTYQMATPFVMLSANPVLDIKKPFEGSAPRIYATLNPAPLLEFDDHASIRVDDIVGMSGGPLFALWMNREGSHQYTVVAVQSRWRDRSRTIAACPMIRMLELLDRGGLRSLACR